MSCAKNEEPETAFSGDLGPAVQIHGVTLRWAKDYVLKNQQSKNPLIFLITDGESYHIDGNYNRYTIPECIPDIQQAIKELVKANIKLFPFAFNQSYDILKEVYQRPIPCDTIEQLTKHLFDMVLKHLKYS